MTNLFHSCLCLSFFILSTSAAMAQDLRQTNSSVMRKLEILNQGKYGTCYAFTGAFLIDYNRFSKNPSLKLRTSPYSVANSSAMASGSAIATSGGDVCGGVNASVAIGKLKAYEDFSDDASYDQVGLVFHRLMVTKILMNYAPHNPNIKFPIMTHAQYKTKSLRNAQQDNLLTLFNKLYENLKSVMSNEYFVPGAYQPSSEEAFFVLQATYVSKRWGSLSQTFISNILVKSVSHSVEIPQINCADTNRPASFSVKIKSELQKNRPVGISFCSTVLSDSKFRASNNLDTKYCSPHAVVLIGYQNFGGEDHFLIRNSWGKNFNYDHNWIYDQGDLWVSSEALVDNIHSLHFVK